MRLPFFLNFILAPIRKRREEKRIEELKRAEERFKWLKRRAEQEAEMRKQYAKLAYPWENMAGGNGHRYYR